MLQTSTTIVIGGTFDLDGDEVKLEMECTSCFQEDEESFFYNNTSKGITVKDGTPVGTYRMRIRLSDDHETDPKAKLFNFNIVVKEQY